MAFGDAFQPGRDRAGTPMADALRTCRQAFWALFFFSGLINILMLTGSFYMLQVYDRVLMSNSVPTLVMLSVMALIAFFFQGGLEIIRTRIFGRVAERVDLASGPELYNHLVRMQASRPGMAAEQMQPFRDLELIRGFLSGAGPVAFFDLPWLPIYLVLCFVLHPIIGWFALLCVVLLVVVAFASEAKQHKPALVAHEAASRRNVLAGNSLQAAEAIVSMGMLDVMRQRWQVQNNRYSTLALKANDVSSSLAAASRTLRMVIQSATLGLGAYLVIKGEMTAGTIIAASIISARAIAPIDMVVTNYRGFQQARLGYKRLTQLFRNSSQPSAKLLLMPPQRSLTVENIVMVAPSDGRPIIKGATFRLAAGQGLGIIGHSASGKSTLGRALVGLWQPARGQIVLDGAALQHWSSDQLGQHIGYLPHDVQLFEGTIAENISRFKPNAPADKIHRAAVAAGCYEQLLAMPQGMNTLVGSGGLYLSAGQRQRIGLARALYDDPFLVVLDEPNSNLDADGEQAVSAAIMQVRQRGGIAIVIAHRPSAIAAVDALLVLRDGFVVGYGDKGEVLRNNLASTAATQVATGNAPPAGLAPARGNPGLPRVENGPSGGSGV
jgi:PrtD family type I secretion system ABC transporter